jgi:hypothetical protein
MVHGVEGRAQFSGGKNRTYVAIGWVSVLGDVWGGREKREFRRQRRENGASVYQEIGL